MNWFRCYAEFATDPKVQILSENMQRRLIMLFCLRCSDVLVTLHVTELAFALRISEQELQETKMLFIEKGFIDEEWNLLNWNKRQFVSDSSAERTRRYRERKKKQDVTSQPRHGDALDTYTDTDTDKKKINKKEKLPLPEWLPLDEWSGFLEVRKKKNKVPTDRAKQMLIIKLDELRRKGHDPAEVINQSIVNSWSGFFEIRGNYGNTNYKPKQTADSNVTAGLQRFLLNNDIK